MVRRVKKRTWYGRRYMSKGGAARLIRDVKMIKSRLNTELHAYTRTYTQTPTVSGQWSIAVLNQMAKGNDFNDRTGDSVRLKSVHINGKVTVPELYFGLNNFAGIQARLIIFVEKDVCNYSTTPDFSDLYYNESAANIRSTLRNWKTLLERKYTVLLDKHVTLDNDNPTYDFRYYKKLSMITKWDPYADANTGGEIIRNRLFCAVITDTPTAATSFNMDTRVTYVDN